MHAFKIVLRTMGVQVGNQFASQICYNSGSHLLSHTVSSAVPSAAWVLTIVFGMGTGVTLRRIATSNGLKWTRTTDLTLIRRAL